MITNLLLDLITSMDMITKNDVNEYLKDLQDAKQDLINNNKHLAKNIFNNINLTLLEIQILIYFLEQENILTILKELEKTREIELENMRNKKIYTI